MKILIDTDILIDLALDRKPHAENADKLFKAIEKGLCEGYVAWHSISNFYYMTSSALGKKLCREYVHDLCQVIEIPKTSTNDMIAATSLEMNDFEDAMQCAAGLAANVNFIVTRNISDYKKSPLDVLKPADFLKRIA
jgi:predicted nucleic acid-binding protein